MHDKGYSFNPQFKLFAKFGAMLLDVAREVSKTTTSQPLHITVPLHLLDTAASPNSSNSPGQSNKNAPAKSKHSSNMTVQHPAATVTMTTSEAVSRIAHRLLTGFCVLYAWVEDARERQDDPQAGPSTSHSAGTAAAFSSKTKVSEPCPGAHSCGFMSTDLEASLLISGLNVMTEIGPYAQMCASHLGYEVMAARGFSGAHIRKGLARGAQPDNLAHVWQPQVGSLT